MAITTQSNQIVRTIVQLIAVQVVNIQLTLMDNDSSTVRVFAIGLLGVSVWPAASGFTSTAGPTFLVEPPAGLFSQIPITFHA